MRSAPQKIADMLPEVDDILAQDGLQQFSAASESALPCGVILVL